MSSYLVRNTTEDSLVCLFRVEEVVRMKNAAFYFHHGWNNHDRRSSLPPLLIPSARGYDAAKEMKKCPTNTLRFCIHSPIQNSPNDRRSLFNHSDATGL